MIPELLLSIVIGVFHGMISLLPSYSSMPIPEWVFLNVTEVFRVIGLIIELPVVRVGYTYFKWMLILWSSIWLWNILLKIIATVPLFGGVAQWKIKANKFKV